MAQYTPPDFLLNGGWSAVWDIAERDAQGNAISGRGYVLDGRDNLIQSELALVSVIGLAGVAVIAFLISWVAMHVAFQKQSPKLMTALWITLGLLVVGVALTFPPIYMGVAAVFAPK